jgi:hypothetical protein
MGRKALTGRKVRPLNFGAFMSYIGSKEEGWLLLERRLQDNIRGYASLANAEANKGHEDLMSVYAEVAQFCLQQLEKVQEAKKADNYEVHFPHIDAVFNKDR